MSTVQHPERWTCFKKRTLMECMAEHLKGQRNWKNRDSKNLDYLKNYSKSSRKMEVLVVSQLTMITLFRKNKLLLLFFVIRAFIRLHNRGMESVWNVVNVSQEETPMLQLLCFREAIPSKVFFLQFSSRSGKNTSKNGKVVDSWRRRSA